MANRSAIVTGAGSGIGRAVASLVAFPVSDAAAFITDSHHLVDGGYVAG